MSDYSQWVEEGRRDKEIRDKRLSIPGWRENLVWGIRFGIILVVCALVAIHGCGWDPIPAFVSLVVVAGFARMFFSRRSWKYGVLTFAKDREPWADHRANWRLLIHLTVITIAAVLYWNLFRHTGL